MGVIYHPGMHVRSSSIRLGKSSQAVSPLRLATEAARMKEGLVPCKEATRADVHVATIIYDRASPSTVFNGSTMRF